MKFDSRKRPKAAPPMGLWFRTLLRSPVKTALTGALAPVRVIETGSGLVPVRVIRDYPHPGSASIGTGYGDPSRQAGETG